MTENTPNITNVQNEEATSVKSVEQKHSGMSRLWAPFTEMDHLFESFFPRGVLRPARMDWPVVGELKMPFEGKIPHIDVVEKDDSIIIRAELPGVNKDQLEISMTENALSIQGTVEEEKSEDGEYHRREITRGSIARSINLPRPVNPDQAKASFKDGLLEIVAPKMQKSMRKTITVE